MSSEYYINKNDELLLPHPVHIMTQTVIAQHLHGGNVYKMINEMVVCINHCQRWELSNFST